MTAPACGFIREIKYYGSLESTNLTAKELASAGAPEGTLIIAEKQTAGRGRTGNSWYHPERSGDALAMSMILRPTLPPEDAAMLTLTAAVSVRDAIENETGLQTDIKWPNDILFKGRKLCGILTEGVFSAGTYYAVLGIGLDVNAETFPEELNDIACSIMQCTGEKADCDRLVTAIFEQFARYYEILQADGNLRRIYERYNACCLPYSEIDCRGRQTKAFDNKVPL